MSAHLSIVPIILCGGSGTRLWPLSRTGFPKQFLALDDTETLFQRAFMRLQSLAGTEVTISKNVIVTNEEQRFLALDQYLELKARYTITSPIRFLLEPLSKNTAPALTLAALDAMESGEDPMLVITPADQAIRDEDAFTKALHQALQVANENVIVILGIKATKPEIGYGYIQVDPRLNKNAYKVMQFTEKPHEDQALQYLQQGNYYWNSGMFVLRASLWKKALGLFRGDILKAVYDAWKDREADVLSQVDFVRPNKTIFESVSADSIDYAVIEKCPGSEIPIQMVPLNAGWTDLGAWDSVWQVSHHDTDGNVTIGDVLSAKSHNNLVIADHRLVSVVGVSDLVVVETADAVLVTSKKSSQEVKVIVTLLEQGMREEKNLHRKVYRPWGWYDTVDEGENFKVKRIQVKPGASLSLQMHHHRAEHWIVVKGIAQITNGDQIITLHENESTFIQLGQKHRLTNPGANPLEIIEVQSGSYLGEDDIVRFGDIYKR
jgi:mannose-1-phosphate guanylyltransferase / mannose-6-phosphate isomerase